MDGRHRAWLFRRDSARQQALTPAGQPVTAAVQAATSGVSPDRSAGVVNTRRWSRGLAPVEAGVTGREGVRASGRLGVRGNHSPGRRPAALNAGPDVASAPRPRTSADATSTLSVGGCTSRRVGDTSRVRSGPTRTPDGPHHNCAVARSGDPKPHDPHPNCAVAHSGDPKPDGPRHKCAVARSGGFAASRAVDDRSRDLSRDRSRRRACAPEARAAVA
jgi:hypothetical protein